jgi:hypothetical protein
MLAQKPWIVPIPGTRNLDHPNENFGALGLELSAAELAELETAFSEVKVHGGRMNEAQMRVVDQTTRRRLGRRAARSYCSQAAGNHSPACYYSW